MAEPDADQTLTLAGAASSSKKSSKKHKKRKHIDVSVEAFPDASTAAAPVVGYFPSGFDPLAASAGEPRVQLFRHAKHSSRLELVVASAAGGGGGGGGGGVEFVGKSYAGEAAMPQLCGYALGVLDKEAGTLKVVPIAGNKILRLEPQLEMNQPAHSEHSEGLTEEGSSATKAERKIQDLTSLYGAKKDRDRDNKWKSLNEHRNDPSAYDNLEFGKSGTNRDIDPNENIAATIVRNIPPYDLSADTAEKAYLLDEIIPRSERPHLLEILGHLDSGEFASKGYPGFVSNRVHKLQELQDGEGKEKLAWILSYITHLVSFLERSRHMSKHQGKQNQTRHGPGTPRSVFQKLLRLFVDPESKALSTEKNELLIGYILVLTLFADDFQSDPTDICTDLKMTFQMLKPYYQQLGCKFLKGSPFRPAVTTLPVPLKFPELTKRRRR